MQKKINWTATGVILATLVALFSGVVWLATAQGRELSRDDARELFQATSDLKSLESRLAKLEKSLDERAPRVLVHYEDPHKRRKEKGKGLGKALSRGVGAVAVTRRSEGEYKVVFTSPFESNKYTAIVVPSGDHAVSVLVQTPKKGSCSVGTFDTEGKRRDSDFNLMIFDATGAL